MQSLVMGGPRVRCMGRCTWSDPSEGCDTDPVRSPGRVAEQQALRSVRDGFLGGRERQYADVDFERALQLFVCRGADHIHGGPGRSRAELGLAGDGAVDGAVMREMRL
jgi:hypothetical protein